MRLEDKMDRVLAMLIQRKEDGTAERLAIFNLSGEEWNITDAGCTDIILV